MSNFTCLKTECLDLHSAAGKPAVLPTAQRAWLAELDTHFATLQHRAFKGEL